MQLAINFLLFVLGFAVATVIALRPRKGRSDLDGFFSKLRHVTNAVKQNSQWDDLEKPQPDDIVNVKDAAPDLLTKEQVERQYDQDTWQGRAYEEFRSTILAKGSGMKTFPCIYATMGYRSNDHRYIFLESDDPSEPRNIRRLAPALRAYLRLSHSLGPNTSLVIMCAPPESDHQKTVEEYNQKFWDMLRGLRIWDTKPWPQEIPQNTKAEKWTFCFDGVPLFPVALTPSHSRRWSRHAPVPLIALQPKWVLDNLLSTPEKREAATSKVRKLLKEYDQIDISPDLTSYGAPGSSEVHQLCLLDRNETVQCPYQDFDK